MEVMTEVQSWQILLLNGQAGDEQWFAISKEVKATAN